MKSKISGILNFLIAIFLLIAVNTFFQPCQSDMKMQCGYNTSAACLILVLIAVLNIGKFFVKDVRGTLFLNIIEIASEIELLFIVYLGGCQGASMACNTRTFPAICIGSILMIVVTVVFEITGLIGNRRKKCLL